MDGKNKTKQNQTNNINNKDNISQKKKKKPSKSGKVVKTIFFVNFKIFSYIINILLSIVLIVIITGGIVAGSFFFYVVNYIDQDISDLTVMSSEADLTTTIYYYQYDNRFTKSNPELKIMDTLHGSENRTWIKYSEITKNNMYIVNAFIALEDKRFFSHNGVDWLRTGDAARNFLFPTDRVFGGSTITQQLVKKMTQNEDQTIQRKIQEMRQAMFLESKTSKEEIMENYLNTVLLSNGCYGVQAAANMFFNKDACDLYLIEAAAIASIVQSPTAMNPIKNPDRNKDRRDACLENMLEYGLITQEEFDGAYDKELVINRPDGDYVETVKSYYVDQIINDVQEDLMKKYNCTKEQASNRVFSGGLSIYACMDEEVQSIMEWVFTHDDYFPRQSEGAIPYQASMVVIDPYNGDLLGIMGGRGEKVQRGWNRASMTRRQPGSSVKPVSVYAPALELRIIDWGTPMNDSPSMRVNGKMWPPNYPAGNEGMISLKRAIAVSKNTTAVRVIRDLTPEKSFRFCYDELNMKSLVEEMVMPDGRIKSDIDVAPLALGGMTRGLTVYELTAAYSIFANEGVYSKPRSYTKVEDKDGNILLDNRVTEKTLVISKANAWIMTKLLREVVDTGTAKGLQMKNKIEVAGKTGTTNDDYDRWFIGFTPYYMCGCWFGYDQPKYLGVDTGAGNPPMILFNYVMNKIHEPIYDDPKKFPEAGESEVVQAPYCASSGMAPGPYCGSTMGYYERGYEPMETCNIHINRPPDEDEEETTDSEDGEETTEPTTEDETTTAPTDIIITTTEEPATEPETEEPTIAAEETTNPDTDTEYITEEPTIGHEDIPDNIQDNWNNNEDLLED